MKSTRNIILIVLFTLLTHSLAFAESKKHKNVEAEPTPTADAQATPATGAAEASEAVDVSKITEKYWAQGKESELGVVQNRKYTTADKIEIGFFNGVISSDPFLSVHDFGLSVGYHFNPYFSLHAKAWRSVSSDSDAYTTFISQTKGTAATNPDRNPPTGFYGIEANGNILYGKMSLFGKMIIYVDLFVLGGFGMTGTQSGSYFTPFLGLGQKVYLSQHWALDIDYRIMRYNEAIQSSNPSLHSAVVGNRVNSSDAINLGISFLF